MGKSLLIVGASVRPWITSAVSAGYRFVALDFFADWDAQRSLNIAPPSSSVMRSIDRFDDVLNAEESANCDAAVVCGGFENRVDLVRSLAQLVQVLGTHPDDLEVLREPLNVWGRLEKFGFQVPQTKTRLESTDHPEQWLQKRVGTSGGLGVRPASIADLGGRLDAGVYYQSIVSGASCSAMFVSTDLLPAGRQTQLIGVTRQLVGERTFGASQFSYCGSIGPIDFPPETGKYLERVGQRLGTEFGLRGVWGLDFVWNEDGVWPVDLNARLTASMELYETSLSESEFQARSVIDLHVQACRGELKGHLPAKPFSGGPWVEGKAVLFNDTAAGFQIDGPCFESLQDRFDPDFFERNQPGFSVADVPHVGQTIEIGCPALTLRVRGRDEREVLEMLESHAEDVFACLGKRGRA